MMIPPPELIGSLRPRARMMMNMTADDLLAMSWLTTLAAVGAEASGHPAWATQLRADAADLLKLADELEGRASI